MSNSFPWSPRQEAIFNSVENETSSLIIEAVAGSGKTTTLVESIQRIQGLTALALAFNKKIATELSQKCPNTTQCKTFNALGHGAWANYTRKKLQLDTKKIWKLTSEHFEGSEENFKIVASLAQKARQLGLVPLTAVGIWDRKNALEDSEENWAEICDFCDTEPDGDLIITARNILLACIEQSFDGIVDFDDQIYMSALCGASFNKYPVVFVDEAQDLSRLQHIIVAKSLLNSGRVIAFGDTHQAIYGFRGALPDSMHKLKERFGMTELPLDISYRCPKAVILAAQRLVPHIKSHESAPQGQIKHMKPWSPKDLRPGTILCRNNAPLFKVAFQMIKAKKSVGFIGRDIGASFAALVKRISSKRISTEQFLARAKTWADGQIAKRPKSEGYINDQLQSLAALCHEDIAHTDQLLEWIKTLFSRENAEFTLSSIHRAKGLEWETVYFLDSWRLPSKFATTEAELQQEDNLTYVAITRSQKNLGYINVDDMEKNL